MKPQILTILAIVFGLMFLFYRRRLKVAAWAAVALVFGALIVRLFVMRDEVEQFERLGLAISAMAGVWLVVNVLTELVRRHRARRVRR